MISRRRILSQSKDNMNYEAWYSNGDDAEVWYNKDKLFRDHILEVLNKWDQIEDEIWAKVIVMEKHRRIAKAYARASIITINGSDAGFDGYRIGINGLGEGCCDAKTEQIKKMIGQGIKLKVDEAGNILIKRLSRHGVYVKNWKTGYPRDECSVSSEIIKMNGSLEQHKAYKLFDMRKFTYNLEKELRLGYPDKRKLENQCISVFSFVKDSSNIFELPCYILIVNIVAMDILRSRLRILGLDEKLLRYEADDKADRSIGEEIQIQLKTENESSSSSKSSSRVTRSSSSPPSSSSPCPSKSRGTLKLNLNELRHKRDSSLPPVELPSPDYDTNDETVTVSVPVKPKQIQCKASYDDPYYKGLRAKIMGRSDNRRNSSILTGYPYHGTTGRNGSHHGSTRFHSRMKKSQSTGYLDSYVSLGPLYSVSSDYSLGDYYSSGGY